MTTQDPEYQLVRPIGRTINAQLKNFLWGKAAGRCEFAGCNRPLWKSAVTQEPVNIGQLAHIYAFSTIGPRPNPKLSAQSRNATDNLMLVCHQCHQTIDRKDYRYPVALLKQWKHDHERRVETVTGIDIDKRSHVVLYGANIGSHSSPLNFNEAAAALFPVRYPAEDKPIRLERDDVVETYPASDHPIELGLINSASGDRDASFWQQEGRNLVRLFETRVRERISAGEIQHLSVFALAPQPLLVLLGTLLIDITNAQVYQRHREPQTWQWPVAAGDLAFNVQRPDSILGRPALVLSLSADITNDRVTSVLGQDVTIWKVTVNKPNNDLIKSREHLSAFRSCVRPLIDEIKAAHGQETTLHIFPAMSVSAAVELGRARMPKAHMPWMVYDQVSERGGFVEAIEIPFDS